MRVSRIIFVAILLPIAIFILYNVKTDPDFNLESAQRIYDEYANGKVYADPLVPEDIRNLPMYLKKIINENPEFVDTELFRAYCRLSSFNPAIIDTQLLEIIEILARTNNIKYFIEFLKMANFSDNLSLIIYTSWRNPNIRNYFTWKRTEETFGFKYWRIRNIFNRIRIDIDNASYGEIEKRLVFAGTDFQMPWTISTSLYERYSYPAMAYIAKIYGNQTKYKYYKNKALSREQLEILKVGIFEYIQYTAKILSVAGEPEIAVRLIESLPPSRKRNLLLKRTLRTILKANGGMDSIKKSNLMTDLERRK